MLKFENPELEKSVLSHESCIAVPFEAFQTPSGEISVLTYSFCEKPAREYLEKFTGDIFSNSSVEWLNSAFGKVMDKAGYEHYSHEGEMMLEYVLTDTESLCRKGRREAEMISSNSDLQALCENTGCSIEINDDGEDVLFAVIEDGKILSYAGINDISYGDGSVEISVETSPDRRREGLGFSCVSCLSEHLLKKGKSIRYKCSLFNKPSSALAEKCGFSLEGKRYSYICGLKEDN